MGRRGFLKQVANFFMRTVQPMGGRPIEEIVMNPEDSMTEEQSEMTKFTELSDTPPPAEEASSAPEAEEMPEAGPPPDPPAPLPAPTLDKLIVQGAAGVQEGLFVLRESRTAIHDAQTNLSATQSAASRAVSEALAQAKDSEGAEEAAETELVKVVDQQIANLQDLKVSLGL